MADTAKEPDLIRQSDTFLHELHTLPQKSHQTLKNARRAYFPVGNGQCVDFVKYNGFEAYSGDAYKWVKYVDKEAFGFPGDAILLDEGPYQHLVLIIGNEGGYNLVEQNYEGLYIVSYRTIPFNYSKIVGIIPKKS